MKHVLILLTDSLYKSNGGMGEQCRKILENWQNEDYFFHVVGHNSTNNQSNSRFYKYYPILPPKISSVQLPDVLQAGFLEQADYVAATLINNIKPDIIHCFDWSSFYAGLVLKNCFNVPLIVTMQLSIELLSKGKIIPEAQAFSLDISKNIEAAGMLSADFIIHVSHYYANQFPWFFKEKSFVLSNGIDHEKWQNSNRIDLPGLKDNKKLLYIGRYAQMKNVGNLSDIVLPDNVDLLFAGCEKGSDPILFEFMKDCCDKLPNRYYIGPYYSQDKVNLFSSVDAVIMPSEHEPFGIVALEAMAAKKPLLTSRVCGLSDFCNDTNTIYCGISQEEIYKGISTWLKKTKSELSELTDNAYKTSLNYKWTDIATNLETIYSRCHT